MTDSRQGFFSVFASEFKRTFLRPKALIFIVLFILAAFGSFAGTMALMKMAADVAAESGEAIATTSSFLGFGIPLSLLSLCFGVYAASFSARDYNDGTLLASLLIVPNRGRLFVARLLPWIIISLASSAIAFALCMLISLSDINDMVNVLGQLGLSSVSCMCSTILGFCCGTITKRGAISVLLYLGLAMILGTAVSAASMAVPENFQFLAEAINAAIPGNAFSHMVNILSPATEGDNSALIACIVSAVWAIGLPIVSFILFKMRATLNRG